MRPRSILLAIGPPDPGWSERLHARVMPMQGLAGYVRHTLLEQAAAPASKIPELKVQVAGIAMVAFASEAVLLQQAGALAGWDPDAQRHRDLPRQGLQAGLTPPTQAVSR